MTISSYQPMKSEDFRKALKEAVRSLSAFERNLYEEWVDRHIWECWNRKTTIVIIKLKSGFEVTGTSGCEDPSKFDEHLGHLYALKDALRKLGEFAAFHRAEVKRMGETSVLKANTQLSPFEIEEIRRLLAKEATDVIRSYPTCSVVTAGDTPLHKLDY